MSEKDYDLGGHHICAVSKAVILPHHHIHLTTTKERADCPDMCHGTQKMAFLHKTRSRPPVSFMERVNSNAEL